MGEGEVGGGTVVLRPKEEEEEVEEEAGRERPAPTLLHLANHHLPPQVGDCHRMLARS
jgi:hypothetical protein